MSGHSRRKYYPRLVARDGECCFVGREPGGYDDFVIDHMDNDNNNNHLSNLHLLCRQMNAIKNPRGNAVLRKYRDEFALLSSVCVRRIQPEGILQPLMLKSQSLEFSKNLYTEPNFRHWCLYCIIHLPQLDYDNVVRCGAEHFNCHKNTVKQYLDRMTSPAGMYQLVASKETGKLVICLKPKFETFRRLNHEKRILGEQAQNWKEDELGSNSKGKIIQL
jgi:hypothetical protein